MIYIYIHTKEKTMEEKMFNYFSIKEKFKKIVDSCMTIEQLKNCENIINNVFEIKKMSVLKKRMELIYKEKLFILHNV